MAYNTITSIDANTVIEKFRAVNILSDNRINRITDGNGNVQVWSSQKNTNNNESVSFSKMVYQRQVLLGPDENGDRPINPEILTFDGNAQLLCNIHNVYISTFDIKTLYSDAYSTALEIYVVYNGNEIILSSTILSMQDFKIAKFDLEFANRYYNNMLAIQALDLRSMILSGDREHLEIVSKIIGIPADQINETLLSTVMYRYGYIERESITVPPVSQFFEFILLPILTKPETPAAWSLTGDLDIQMNVVNNTVVIGMDQSNPDLMNILTQIAGSTELLEITYNITCVGYKTTVDPSDFEYNGVHYDELTRYAITCSNTLEPTEAITIIPLIHPDAELLTVSVLMQITSSRNTISLSKQDNQVFLGTELASLKNIVYKFDTETIKISNVIENKQNVIEFKNTDTSHQISQRSSIQFATLKAIQVNNFDDDVTDDSTAITLELRTMPMVFGVKFITVEEIDLRTYEYINILYAGKSSKPVKVLKDTIYFSLAWQGYDEIGIEINDRITTVLGARKA